MVGTEESGERQAMLGLGRNKKKPTQFCRFGDSTDLREERIDLTPPSTRSL